jgi:hypothetical protein
MAMAGKMKSANPPDFFHRIITVNNEKKLEEITSLISSNMGCTFNIYLVEDTYGFEIVIVDDETVFIHFRKNKKEEKQGYSDNNICLISSTLKFVNHLVAHEFVNIYESIIENSTFPPIECAKINHNNLPDKIKEIGKYFDTKLGKTNVKT